MSSFRRTNIKKRIHTIPVNTTYNIIISKLVEGLANKRGWVIASKVLLKALSPKTAERKKFTQKLLLGKCLLSCG